MTSFIEKQETKPDPAHDPKKEALKTALISSLPSQTRQYRSMNCRRWRRPRKLHANMLRFHNKGQFTISWFPPLTKNHKMCEDDGIEIKTTIKEEATRFWPRFLFYTFWSRLPLRFLVFLWHFFISWLIFSSPVECVVHRAKHKIYRSVLFNL